MIDIEGDALTAEDRELLRHPLIGGVILFARNYVDVDQAHALIEDIRGLRNPRLLVAVDQEGGRVQRFRHGLVDLPSLATLGACYDEDPELALNNATDHGWLMASELRALGVDFSFSPVLDLQTQHSAIIGDRALHAEPNVVAQLARTYVSALQAAGMAAVGKHFPGHGCVAADSHHELPIDQRDFQTIDRHDLLPFRALVGAGIAGIMMAHVAYPQVDDVAAGYSKIWVQEILRGAMQFEGVVFSDDLSMVGADLDGDFANRARLALAAGCDVLLICNHRVAVLDVIKALGSELFPKTQDRLMQMHGKGPRMRLAELQLTARWRAVSERVRHMNRFPETELGDNNLLR